MLGWRREYQGPQSINPITVPAAKVVNAVCRTGTTLYDSRSRRTLVWLLGGNPRVAGADTHRIGSKQFQPGVFV
jgi:hypothetical protein